MPSQDNIILSKMIEQLKNEVAPEISDDSYFELFSNEQILKEYDLSYDEIADGTIGKGGDGGIDGFYVFANGILLNADEDLPRIKGDLRIDLFITQSKNTVGFDESVIQKFQSSAEDIFALEKSIEVLQSTYNPDLLKHVTLFRNLYLENISKHPVLNIKYYYSSKGEEIHINVSRKVDSLKQTVESFFSNADYDFEFLGAKNTSEFIKKET